MELNEKLQQLRKEKGWTQEELAERLYVSRTAISKWESGRGYPSIDSLKAISQLFSVSIDDLLSGEELLSLAASEQEEKIVGFQDLAFGILDCMSGLLFILPVFAVAGTDAVTMTTFMSYTDPVYIWLSYLIIISLNVAFGLLQLVLQNWQNRHWLKNKSVVSFALTLVAILFTIMNRQPYPGTFWLCILVFKGILRWKRP